MSTVLLFLRRPALFLAAVIACAIALRYAMDMVDNRANRKDDNV